MNNTKINLTQVDEEVNADVDKTSPCTPNFLSLGVMLNKKSDHKRRHSTYDKSFFSSLQPHQQSMSDQKKVEEEPSEEFKDGFESKADEIKQIVAPKKGNRTTPTRSKFNSTKVVTSCLQNDLISFHKKAT